MFWAICSAWDGLSIQKKKAALLAFLLPRQSSTMQFNSIFPESEGLLHVLGAPPICNSLLFQLQRLVASDYLARCATLERQNPGQQQGQDVFFDWMRSRYI